MKRLLLLMTLGYSAMATAQPLNTYGEPQHINDAMVYVSPGYGIMYYAGAIPTINVTLGYNIGQSMRISAIVNYGHGDDNYNAFGAALMLGTKNIYDNIYSNIFQEASFGAGYMSFTRNFYYEYYLYNSPMRGMFFPLRYRVGVSLTKNVDFGIDLMLAFTTIRSNAIIYQTGLFLAFKW